MYMRWITLLLVVAALGACSSSSKSSSSSSDGKSKDAGVSASTIGATVKLDSGADQVVAGDTRSDFDKIVQASIAKQNIADYFGTGQAVSVGKCASAVVVDTAIGGERQVRVTDDPQFADNAGKTVWVDATWLKSSCTTPGLAAQGATVSPSCDAAMQAIVNLDPNADDSVVGPVQDASLSACTTKTEWLAAAQKYRSSGIDHCVLCGNATADQVYKAFCDGNADKPACKS